MDYKYPADKLVAFCRNLLIASGVPEEDAEIVALVLVDTSLDGIDTHGISRLPIYLSRLANGRIKARPEIKVNKSGAVASVDGDNGLGQLVGVRSMNVAIGLAKEYGIGFVGTKHSNHFGAASYYCKMAAERKMIGQVFTNSPPGIPPWGGKRPYFGTNPIAFGIPNKDNPVIIDMSSSTVARGNIILAAKEGRPIPEGWAIDKDGKPTTDAKKALEGAVLPMGGPKGYALALAVEVMSGIVTGSAFGTDVGWIYDDSLEPVNIGHSFMAIDVSRLMPVETFEARMEDMIRNIKSIPLAEGVDCIRIPGERRMAIAQERLTAGIPINSSLLNELNEFAQRLGVPCLEN